MSGCFGWGGMGRWMGTWEDREMGWGDGWVPGMKGWRLAGWTVRQKQTEHCCLSDKIIAQHK